MIRVKRLLILAVGGAALLSAQDSSLTVPVIYPPPVLEPVQPLRQYLNLTAAQVSALQEVQKSRQTAEQAVYEEMRQKYQALENLLASGSTDYQQIGRINVELRQLQKKLPVSGEPYRTRALAVLSPDQRTKLPALANALQLQWPANDAVFWNLLDRPETPGGDPRILPAPGPAESLMTLSAAPVTRP
jgi:Spy/CpxP family protein refolding chaperone